MRNGKIRRFRPRMHNKHSSRRSGHSNKSNGIHHIGSHRNNFRNSTPRNPQNLERLVEKYKNLAKEAMSSGDEILNQNYLQHSEHFSRILSEVNESRAKNNNNEVSQDQKNNEVAQDKKVNSEEKSTSSSVEEKK
tara:strand:+ start:3245 stop:3649 length:405 start_codon:yes stop_codon:yes gene_type:complete